MCEASVCLSDHQARLPCDVDMYPRQLTNAGLYDVNIEFSSENAKDNFLDGELGARDEIEIKADF